MVDWLAYNQRVLAFDSNTLTYFLNGNNGDYSRPNDPALTDQQIAAVRLFLYGRPFIPPTVRAEALRIGDPTKRAEHERFIDYSFAELLPDEDQQAWIEQRALELQPHHPKRDLDDCRVVAEIERTGDIPVLVTYDKGLRSLTPYSGIRLETPTDCWASFAIPFGTPPVWSPSDGHPLSQETWWRWE